MEQVKIILENNSEKVVDSIFYLYNSKYYFMYTERQLDEKDYVLFYLVEVGKEIKNTPTGPVDTGGMVGVEISDSKIMQDSITKIVESAKTGNQSAEIQYLPMSMLSTLKIVTKNTFRLMKSVVEDSFKLNLSTTNVLNNEISVIPQQPAQDNLSVQSTTNNLVVQPNSNLNVVETQTPLTDVPVLSEVPIVSDTNINNDQVLNTQSTLAPVSQIPTEPNVENSQASAPSNVIIDYRSRFFEEQEKTKELQLKIDELTQKLDSIKKVIE